MSLQLFAGDVGGGVAPGPSVEATRNGKPPVPTFGNHT